jgi:hypothetical protein
MIIHWSGKFQNASPYYGIGFVGNWIAQGATTRTVDALTSYKVSARAIIKPSARQTILTSERETYKPSDYGDLS